MFEKIYIILFSKKISPPWSFFFFFVCMNIVSKYEYASLKIISWCAPKQRQNSHSEDISIQNLQIQILTKLSVQSNAL